MTSGTGIDEQEPAGGASLRIRYRFPTAESSSRYETPRTTSPACRKKKSDLPEWQTAIEALMLCSRGSPTTMARD